MTIDIKKVRQDTPACEHLIHFNNAGCSLMPQPVQDKLFTYLQQEQQAGGYETEKKYKGELESFYQSAASLINCQASEISFCESNTKAWQQFFYSIAFRQDDEIITSRVDYGSNFVAYIQAAKQKGVKIRYIDTDENGDLNLAHLESLINQKTRLISISHIPTGSGLINPAEQIGALAQQAGVLYLLDACQSAGHLNLDVAKIKCTALTCTGRKYLRGPRGTGFLYLSKDYCDTAQPAYLEQQGVTLIDHEHYELVDGARRFENFECHFAGKLALKAAIDYAHALGMFAVESRIKHLANSCRQQLKLNPRITINDVGSNQCGIVTFSVAGRSPTEVRELLSSHGINIWISTGPGSLIDFQDRGLESVCRASLHYYNDEQEIDKMCEILERHG